MRERVRFLPGREAEGRGCELSIVGLGYAIEVQGLRKSYGSLVAVDGISFTVREREIFGLLGPNGAGKTTTVEILEGLRQADAGTVMVAGVDVRRDPKAVKRLIGVQLQSSAFFSGLLMFLSGIFFPRSVLPGWLQTITQYSPLSYVSDGLRSISVDGASLWAVRWDLVGISVWLVISAAIAARLFRWEVT